MGVDGFKHTGGARKRAYLILVTKSIHDGCRRVQACRMSRSTIGGGRGCNKIVPVLGGDGTRIAPPEDLFDQPPREMMT